MEKKKQKCYNCKFASEPFKAGKMTHVHCQNESVVNDPRNAWDTLREWWDKCSSWQMAQTDDEIQKHMNETPKKKRF